MIDNPLTDPGDILLVKFHFRRSIVGEITPTKSLADTTGRSTAYNPFRDQRSPERLNALFDRIKDRRVDIEWMKRREFEVSNVIARWRFVKM
jgi:hypothetical protein